MLFRINKLVTILTGMPMSVGTQRHLLRAENSIRDIEGHRQQVGVKMHAYRFSECQLTFSQEAIVSNSISLAPPRVCHGCVSLWMSAHTSAMNARQACLAMLVGLDLSNRVVTASRYSLLASLCAASLDNISPAPATIPTFHFLTNVYILVSLSKRQSCVILIHVQTDLSHNKTVKYD